MPTSRETAKPKGGIVARRASRSSDATPPAGVRRVDLVQVAPDVWTPRKSSRRSVQKGMQYRSCSPFDPQSHPVPPPQRRLVAPAPQPASVSAPGLWAPRGSEDDQHKSTCDLIGVTFRGKHSALRYHTSPRRAKVSGEYVPPAVPYGDHPGAKRGFGMDMALLRDHDFPAPGDFIGGLTCSANRRTRSLPPPPVRPLGADASDIMQENSALRAVHVRHARGPPGYNFRDSPAAIRQEAEFNGSGKVCYRSPAAQERSVLTGSGFVESPPTGLSFVREKGFSRRAATPGPEGQVGKFCMDESWHPRHRLNMTALHRRSEAEGVLQGRYYYPGNTDADDPPRGAPHQQYGCSKVALTGPGRRLYTTGRVHDSSDLYGAGADQPTAPARGRRLSAGSTPGSRVHDPQDPNPVSARCPYDATWAGGRDIPRTAERWRPGHRHLRSHSMPLAGGWHSSAMRGHEVLTDQDEFGKMGRAASPGRLHSLRGSGIDFTPEANHYWDPQRATSCPGTPRSPRSVHYRATTRCSPRRFSSSFKGTGLIDNLQTMSPRRVRRQEGSCGTPLRPRDNLSGAAAQMLPLSPK
eukprot:TRINITY_DN3162_c1_g2_i3.p1 TRINITY_DN3162_c1_g2~~TRINITY_DN3162_c1_g2_i3.p1  ORF type:complete len:580 (+),score=92.18 TRINITY_DN3162_c1_g2_i3:83-1822(+)